MGKEYKLKEDKVDDDNQLIREESDKWYNEIWLPLVKKALEEKNKFGNIK